MRRGLTPPPSKFVEFPFFFSVLEFSPKFYRHIPEDWKKGYSCCIARRSPWLLLRMDVCSLFSIQQFHLPILEYHPEPEIHYVILRLQKRDLKTQNIFDVVLSILLLVVIIDVVIISATNQSSEYDKRKHFLCSLVEKFLYICLPIEW